jgi:hypothetical protein
MMGEQYVAATRRDTYMLNAMYLFLASVIVKMFKMRGYVTYMCGCICGCPSWSLK